MIKLVVPLLPPSVNNYVRHTGSGRHYKTEHAERFGWAMAAAVHEAGYPALQADAYEVAITFYFGKGRRLDWDNGIKVPMDCLVALKVIDSDAKITKGTVIVERDWENPRTEIQIAER